MSEGTVVIREEAAPYGPGLGSSSKTRLMGGSAGSTDPTQPTSPAPDAHPLLAAALKHGCSVTVVVRGLCPNLPASDRAFSASPGGYSHYGERAIFAGTLVAFDTRGSLVLSNAEECGWRLEPLLPLMGENLPSEATNLFPPLAPVRNLAGGPKLRFHEVGSLPRPRSDVCESNLLNSSSLNPPHHFASNAINSSRVHSHVGCEGDALRWRRERAAAEALEERRRVAAEEGFDDEELARSLDNESAMRTGDSSMLAPAARGHAVWVLRSRLLGHVVLRSSTIISVSIGCCPRPKGMGFPLPKRVRGRVTGNDTFLFHDGSQVWP